MFLLLEILGNMCIVIIYCPVCDVINFEINLSFLIRPGQIARLMPIGRAQTCKTSETRPFLLYKKEKIIRSTNLQSNR